MQALVDWLVALQSPFLPSTRPTAGTSGALERDADGYQPTFNVNIQVHNFVMAVPDDV
jgi:hypothetical protein